MTARLHIVIVTWNSRDDVLRCLGVLGDGGGEWVVWVVDDASADGTVDAVRTRFPWVRLIANAENVGFARANNQAIAQTESEYVLLLNPDTELTPQALRTAVAEMEQHPRAGLVALQLRNTDGTLQPSCFRFPSPWFNFLVYTGLYLLTIPPSRRHELLAGWWAHDQARAVDWVLGAFMLVRREAIDAVGLLPEEYYIFGEDLEWCHRMRRAGFEVHFTPAASLTHHSNRSAGQRPVRWRTTLSHQAKYAFCRRHYGGAATRLIQVTDLVGYTLRRLRYAAPALSGADPHRRLTHEVMAVAQRAVWHELWSTPSRSGTHDG